MEDKNKLAIFITALLAGALSGLLLLLPVQFETYQQTSFLGTLLWIFAMTPTILAGYRHGSIALAIASVASLLMMIFVVGGTSALLVATVNVLPLSALAFLALNPQAVQAISRGHTGNASTVILVCCSAIAIVLALAMVFILGGGAEELYQDLTKQLNTFWQVLENPAAASAEPHVLPFAFSTEEKLIFMEVIEFFALFAPALVASIFPSFYVLNLGLANMIQEFIAWPKLHHYRTQSAQLSNSWALASVILALICAFFLMNEWLSLWYIFSSVLGGIIGLQFINGYSTIHLVTQKLKGRGILLSAVYFMGIFIPPFAMLVWLFGALEPMLGVKARYLNRINP